MSLAHELRVLELESQVELLERLPDFWLTLAQT